jgi:hypothetical protein
MTMTEPPPEMEEEFNAWYDCEHLPERLAIAGFRSARRWVAATAPGEGKYLTTYELDSPRVLDTREYLGHVGQHFTPWSKRCLGKALVFRRWACEQVQPGDADPHPEARALGLIAAEDEPSVQTAAASGMLQARRFVALSGTPRCIGLYELADAAFAEGLRRILPLERGHESIFRIYHAYSVTADARTPR